MELSRRAKSLKPSPTLALATKAKELKAQGKDVISLSVGEPDWDTFDVIKQAGRAAIEEGFTKYVPASGLPELRTAIANQFNKDFNTNYEVNNVTVSAGGKFVIFSALQSLIDPGDEVIIPSPYWVSYPTQVELAEGKPVTVTTKEENGFKITAAELEVAITPKTKLIILNSPSNPTGNAYDESELKALADVLKKNTKVCILSDDIYNRLVFNPSGLAPHLLGVAPELGDRTLCINGLSKTYSMTGWRLGWALGPKEWIAAMNKYQSQSVSCAAGFTQKAAVVAIEQAEGELKESLKVLKTRKDFVVKAMGELPDIKVASPDGAFYVWPNISSYLGKTWNGKKIETSNQFSEALLESEMVAAVPGAEFGQEGFLRISYALDQGRMQEALDRISNFLKGFN